MFYRFILPFLIALQFLSIIPIRLPMVPTTWQNALSLLFYPVVGLLFGVVLWSVARFLPMPVMLLSCLVMAIWVWLTGGLHLDGLADTADGWVGGYGDKERTLAIMKDSHIGVMGVLAIVVVLALKWASIYSLLEKNATLSFLFVPMMGRLSVLLLFLTTPYISKNGLGMALQGVPKYLLGLVLGVCATFVFILLWQQALIVLGVWLLLVLHLRYLFIKRLDGMTGDTLGASVELVEMGLLVAMVVM